MTIEVVPTSPAIGAEVRSVDIAAGVDEPTFGRIIAAWHQYSVLLFRGQRLDDAALVRFSRRFGELDAVPPNEVAKIFIKDYPEISVISNVKGTDGKPIGSLGAYESEWHTDMSFMDVPPKASALYSLEVPPSGGNTGFANMYLALERLPADLRRQIEGKVTVHDATLTSVGSLRMGFQPVTDVTRTPGARHPLVRTHPETGRQALYLGRRRNSYVVGLTVAESEALLNALWAHASRPEFSWHHQWRVGDLVLWDNRSAMHRRDAFDPAARRVMHRTQIKGTVPF
ncbi:MAG: TauD/TfdA family dioxygenase [Alphaproteobacteria bacterium]|nr:TauD/TfdA family dioxygenase [Alphaproteobacteria bacterium]